jgi:hypothetical protein
MPNGKGTIMCCYCANSTWGEQYRCNLYGVALPVKEHGADNLLCGEFTSGNACESAASLVHQLEELAPHMRKGYLYAFPYPSRDTPRDLQEIMPLANAQ